MKVELLITTLFVVAFPSACNAARNVFGSCPSVPPMQDFNMTRFEGVWYVVEAFDSRIRCMTWNITRMTEDVWSIVESKQSGLTKVYNGKLMANSDNPAALTVSWDINVGGSYPFTVYATDYDNYAGVFMCQKVIFYNRQQGTILSRSPLIPISLRQEAMGKLAGHGVAMSYFYKVEQGHCGYGTEAVDQVTKTELDSAAEGIGIGAMP